MNIYDFYTGNSFDAYNYLGAHRMGDNLIFRTFAPNAKGVSLLLHGKEIPMMKVYDGNFFEASYYGAYCGESYEYRIYNHGGGYVDHSDPFSFQMELRPNHKSVICDLNEFKFSDSKWINARSVGFDKPINIYEMHIGSWKKKGDDTWYTYREIAPLLIAYLKDSGYNYVEFLPLCEHPCDESWGYQNIGFFSPTSRYGSPSDLKFLINELHQNNIGAILDFVPVHFAVDEYALAKYDGSALYEYPHSAVGVSEWGSYNFMHSRGEVRSFLQSSANFWLKEFHFDGLRMDAISRIIYWQGDPSRGVNNNAVNFIKVMNKGLKAENPNCLLIAEDSTNYPRVTTPVDWGGLGFDYKWDMGWMHDTLEYFKLSPTYRSENYHKLTFSMMYYWDENYLLALSHDEVVHGKATILQKMNGQYEEKFPQARAMYLYMLMHPGKKLNFMGNEFGQLREWDEKREQDWDILKYPNHDSFYRYMRDLNKIYLSHSALYEMDYSTEGFSWIDCNCTDKCIYAMERKSKSETLIAVLNLSDKNQKYTIPSAIKNAEVLINTDHNIYSGKSKTVKTLKTSDVTLPPFSGILIKV